jgi:hypothetical protein
MVRASTSASLHRPDRRARVSSKSQMTALLKVHSPLSRPARWPALPCRASVGAGQRPSKRKMGFPSSFHRVRTIRLWTKEGPNGNPTHHRHSDPAVRWRLQLLPALRIGHLRAADPSG